MRSFIGFSSHWNNAKPTKEYFTAKIQSQKKPNSQNSPEKSIAGDEWREAISGSGISHFLLLKRISSHSRHSQLNLLHLFLFQIPSFPTPEPNPYDPSGTSFFITFPGKFLSSYLFSYLLSGIYFYFLFEGFCKSCSGGRRI